jgi:GNAT superfamily N-acetyltransferase
MVISVDRATPSHAEIIARFNQLMAEETEGKSLSWDVILPGVAAVFDDERLGFYLVARVDEGADGEVAGCLAITYEWSDWRNGLFWWIQSVYVDKAHRGKGVFTAMYEQVKMLARQTDNVCGIRLYVEVENETAQRTYFRLGMQETHYRLLEEEF